MEQRGIDAYQFDSEVDMMKYLVSGGMHLYNKNYKGSDRWVRLKLQIQGCLWLVS